MIAGFVEADTLPPHVAVADEPITAPFSHPVDQYAGPDMRSVAPIDQMMSWLDALAADQVAYIPLWLALVQTVGCSVGIHDARNGSTGLSLWSPVDVQVRHRSRWMHYLFEHLDGIEGMRDALQAALIASRQVMSERPVRPRELAA